MLKGCARIVAGLGFAVALATGASAQQPDEIFSKSTVWKPLTPDDKLVLYGLDDPAVEGVACHYTVPEKGGVKGMLGVAEEVSDISLACRQIGPIRFKEKFEQGVDRVQRAPLARLQAHAHRARLRRQAQRPRLHGLFGPADRGLAQELDLERADHAVGHERGHPEMRRVVIVTLSQRERSSARPESRGRRRFSSRR